MYFILLEEKAVTRVLTTNTTKIFTTCFSRQFIIKYIEIILKHQALLG